MPPRISLFAPQSLALRPRASTVQEAFNARACRFISNDAGKKGVQEPAKSEAAAASQTAIPHVSEEQAALDKIMGEVPPQVDEQSTPIQEILQRDKEAQKNAPEVFKKGNKTPSGGQSRSYSTSARKLSPDLHSTSAAIDAHLESMLLSTKSKNIVPVKFEETRAVGMEYPDAGPGHKFPLPDMDQWKVTNHLRRRYDPVVDQFTKMIMQDGKLARAQKNMSEILHTLRTAPTPNSNTQTNRVLLSDTNINTSRTTSPAVARAHLPLSPIQYLTSVIDSVAPLLKIRQQKGVMGGGQSLPIPVPLRIKQRRRAAIKWILDGSEKRSDVKMADRVAKEIIAVAQGSSGVWEKRAMVHRQAVTARSNIRNQDQNKKKRKIGF